MVFTDKEKTLTFIVSDVRIISKASGCTEQPYCLEIEFYKDNGKRIYYKKKEERDKDYDNLEKKMIKQHSFNDCVKKLEAKVNEIECLLECFK